MENLNWDQYLAIASIIISIICFCYTFSKDRKVSKEKRKTVLYSKPRLCIDGLKSKFVGQQLEGDYDYSAAVVPNINGNFFDISYLLGNNYFGIKYTFKNGGITPISSIELLGNNSNYHYFFLRDKVKGEKGFFTPLLWSFNRVINPEEEFNLLITFPESLLKSEYNPAAMLSIYLKDINGNIWEQPLFIPDFYTDDSSYISEKEYLKIKKSYKKQFIDIFKN